MYPPEIGFLFSSSSSSSFYFFSSFLFLSLLDAQPTRGKVDGRCDQAQGRCGAHVAAVDVAQHSLGLGRHVAAVQLLRCTRQRVA